MKNVTPVYGKDYKDGHVYFVFTDDSFVSNGIAWFQYRSEFLKIKNKVSHCGIVTGKNQGTAALSKGISFEDLTPYFTDPHKHIFFKELKLLDSIGSISLLIYCAKSIGIKYDWSLILGFAIINSTIGVRLPQRLRNEILRFFDCKDRLVCSEFVAKALYYCGFIYNKIFRVMPSDLVESNIFKEFYFSC